MKLFLAFQSNTPRARRRGERGSVRTLALAAVCFLLGLGVGAFWIYRETRPATEPAGAEGVPLSEATRAVLQRLDGPVEIRFYALLDPASTSDALRAFAGRVDQLLAAYESAAGGKLKVVRRNTLSAAAADAASADGMQPFNLDKGEACYLGLAVARDSRKELLPRLALEWEPALESDLSRAIEHLASTRAAAPSVAAASKPDPAVIEAVKRVIPELTAVSVEDGTRILREAALAEYKAEAQAMQAQLKDAQQQIAQAQAGGSEADRQAALKHLQDVQTEQMEKLKAIAARSQAQIDALQQLKKSAP